MRIETSRFGELTIDSEAIIFFPDGIVGFSDNRQWVLLGESESDAVGWLQSVSAPELAVAVVTPHRFAPGFCLRFHRDEITSLPWGPEDEAIVLAIVGHNGDQLTMNLKAPLLINLNRRIGRQVLTSDEQPLQYALTKQVTAMRKSA